LWNCRRDRIIFDAAISTASRIVDETDWIAAMEVIAVGQLEGGDHTGALHTAKLMTPAINRNGVLTRIAFTQAHSGNVKGAIATVTHIDAPLRRNAVLLGIAIIRARHGDLPGALAAADTVEGEISRATAYREIGDLADDQYPHSPDRHFLCSAWHGEWMPE
jgi:hypothetical protein